MDAGSPDEAIALLEEARKLDPSDWSYDYEMGFAHAVKGDYTRAIKIFNEIVKRDDASDQCFQMLGNYYDISGDPGKALKIYDKGLKRFPNSGRLYLEKGNVFFGQKKYEEALPFYEMGIGADPGYPSNYFRAALLYCNSHEEVWGMLYGEIFINLERNTKRTQEISKLLYDTYKSEISIKDTSAVVSFSEAAIVVSPADLKQIAKGKKGLTIPFGITFETELLLAINGEKQIDLESLHRIRKRFIDSYYSLPATKDSPNALFEYQRFIDKVGFLDCYNHWVLMSGDMDSFEKWKNENHDRWSQFTAWFNENGLLLDKNHKFSRYQYD